MNAPLTTAGVPPLIELRGIARTYRMGGGEVHALRDVDLAIGHGEFVAIVGPSGSGKTTLMYLLGLLDRPTAGSYRLAGAEVAALSDRRLSRIRNREIGYVFQQYNLLPTLSVVDNIALGLTYAGVSRAQRRELASALATEMGLGHRLGHTARELSGGQMQRVAIARGLACRPHLILADEPTGNLDSKTGAEIMALLKDLNARGHTVVLVTHDQEIAAQARRIVRIVDGAIVSDERTDAAPPPSDAALRGGPGGKGLGFADLARMAAREGVLAHKLRSALTMLGIVFGIAAVIAMTAITEGGKRRQLEQIRQIGMNSIQVRGLDLDGARLMRVRRLCPDGVAPGDFDAIRRHVGGIDAAAAWKTVKAEIRLGGDAVDDARTLGVTGDFERVVNFHVGRGRFLVERDEAEHARVCVLGSAVADKLRLGDNALGASVLVGDEPFTVVGVMAAKAYASSDIADLAIADRNHDVYVPYATLRAYFRKDARAAAFDVIALRMDSDERLLERSRAIKRIVDDLHRGADDFAVSVPLESLKQAQRTKEVFNVIIVVIAAISLIVGGIGIMNIMLASVTERTREIGIRRAVGAGRGDVLRQFLAEALLISASGGVLGLALGLGGGLAIEAVFGFAVAFDGRIMALAVGTALAVGLGFGIYPAWLAAEKDPVEALRQ